MSTSATEILNTVRTWRRRRFGHALFVPVALTLVVASLVGAPWPNVSALAARLSAAWLGVLAMRLWDDLEDRAADALTHPARILTTVDTTAPYAWLVVGSLAGSTALLALGGGAPLIWASLLVALFVFYRLHGQRRWGGRFIILLKYPILAAALGASLEPLSLAAHALLFSAVCADEVLQQLTPRPLARAALLTLTFGILLVLSEPPIGV